jgi:hypothetical protein
MSHVRCVPFPSPFHPFNVHSGRVLRSRPQKQPNPQRHRLRVRTGVTSLDTSLDSNANASAGLRDANQPRAAKGTWNTRVNAKGSGNPVADSMPTPSLSRGLFGALTVPIGHVAKNASNSPPEAGAGPVMGTRPVVVGKLDAILKPGVDARASVATLLAGTGTLESMKVGRSSPDPSTGAALMCVRPLREALMIWSPPSLPVRYLNEARLVVGLCSLLVPSLLCLLDRYLLLLEYRLDFICASG